MRKKIFTCMIFTACILVFSCAGKDQKSSIGGRELFFIRSHTTGTFFSAGSAWARLVTSNTSYIGVNISAHADENEKIRMLAEGRIQIAFLKGPEANLAYNGDPVYWKEPQHVRALVSLWPAVYSLIAHRESGIEKIEDIKGKSIAIYSDGSVTGDIFEYLLGLYGINDNNTMIYRVRDTIGINMFMLKVADCVWYDVGYGEYRLKSPFITESGAIAEADSYVLVPVEADSRIREFFKIYPFFYLDTFGSSIGLKESLQLTTSGFAACHADLPEDAAYNLTKLWWENRDFIRQYVSDVIDLIDTTDNRRGVPIPFHKGAVRYLREAGLIPSE